jgi:hypothetical protein
VIEAASSGNLSEAVAAVPSRPAVTEAARQAVIAGLNTTLILGAALALTGAALTLWLLRYRTTPRT